MLSFLKPTGGTKSPAEGKKVVMVHLRSGGLDNSSLLVQFDFKENVGFPISTLVVRQ